MTQAFLCHGKRKGEHGQEHGKGEGEERENKQFPLKEINSFPLKFPWNLFTWTHLNAKEAGKRSLKLGGLCPPETRGLAGKVLALVLKERRE